MNEMVKFLSAVGNESIHFYWTPLLIWTILSLTATLAIHFLRGISTKHLYHSHLALLITLPVGYLSYGILHSILNSASIPYSMTIYIDSPAIIKTAAASHAISFTPETWIGLIIFLFAVGGILKLAQILLNQITIWRFRRHLFLSHPTQIQELNHENKNLIASLKRAPGFALIPDKSVPLTFGIFKTVILLPDYLQKYPDKFNLAVRHELEHIKSHDYLRFWIIHFIEAFFWYHPLVRYLGKYILIYREMQIDQTVIYHNRSLSTAYAHLLLDLADSTNRRTLSPTGLASRPTTVKRRIKAMVYSEKTKRNRWLSAGLIILTFLISLAMGCNNIISSELPKKMDQSGTPTAVQINPLNDKKPPLFVIDGVVANHKTLKSLSPDKIMSITVLKGNEGIQKYGPKGKNGVIIITTKNNEKNIYVAVQQMPILVGGLASLQSKLQYPQLARKAGIEGRVYVQFIVDEKGNVTDAKVIRGIGGGCDQEALRVVRSAKFKPGMQRGRPVRVRYSLPIIFKLADAN